MTTHMISYLTRPVTAREQQTTGDDPEEAVSSAEASRQDIVMKLVARPCYCRCHIILRPHPKNRPRLSRDNKIDDISLNTHTNRFKFKPHISSMYIHTFGK